MDVIRNEFKKSRFNFTHDKPEDFAAWAWQHNRTKISGYFIGYRFFVAALFLSILVSYGSLTENPNFFFIYITNLGFIIETLHLVVSAFVPIEFLYQKAYKPQNNGILKWTFLGRFSWFLYNVSNLASIAISVIYWTALFTAGSGLEVRDFLVHGFNSIMTIVDIVVSGRPCRLMHFYQPFVVWLAYIAFSTIYWVAGGVNEDGDHYIYPILDWDNLSLTVPFVTIGMLIALPVTHTLIWGLHLLRDFTFRKCVKGKNKNQETRQGQTNPAFELV